MVSRLISPPQTEAELLSRAHQIAGYTLARLAAKQGLVLPTELIHAKGWVGQLLEGLLGTTAGVKSAPDFEALGVELKTLPIDKYGKPRETTYVCTVPMLQLIELSWHNSSVYKKLARVLWLPIEADPAIPLPERKVGTAILWSPTAQQEGILRQDWEELMEMVCLGQVEEITANRGVYLQIRPKAANAQARRRAVGAEGESIATLPRGFYLRTSFTGEILRMNYAS